jgi:hypothetical protein
MKHAKRILLATVSLLCISMISCATVSGSKNLQIKVSAPSATKFSCKFEFGNSSGSVSTTTSGQRYETILDIPLNNGSAEFVIQTPNAVLTAVVFEKGRERFSFRNSTNTPSFRLIRDNSEWRTETAK